MKLINTILKILFILLSKRVDMKAHFLTLAFCAVLLFSNTHAQDKLYSNEFPLGDVTLLDGPFKSARDLNIQYLLQHDADRCLAPYLKIAGFNTQGRKLSKLGKHWSGRAYWRALFIGDGDELRGYG
jgi:hypothetical protein